MAKPIGYCKNNKQVDQTNQRFPKIRGYHPLTTVIIHRHLMTIKAPHIFRACGTLISHQYQTHTSQMLKIFQIKTQTETPTSRSSTRNPYTFNKSDINKFVKSIN